MSAFDYVILVCYLAGIISFGLALRGKDKSDREFFLAGRSMRWAPIGLSLMATSFSAVNYAALPTEVFSHGIYVVTVLGAFVLVAFPVAFIFIPFYYSQQLTSVYEYLERRFDVRVRRLAGALYIFWRVLWMGTILYATGKILSVFISVDFRLLIVLTGVSAMVYSAVGGMRSVMWTDVAQVLVLVGSVVAGILFALSRMASGPEPVSETLVSSGILKPVIPFDPLFFSFDPRIRITFWSAILGGSVAFLARYAADQTVVQRYFTARSLKDARRGFSLSIVVSIFVLGLFMVFGLLVHLQMAQEGMANPLAKNPMESLLGFVNAMPRGITGLVAAGLLAATMSSVDSGMNSCSAIYISDFYSRFARAKSIVAKWRLNRLLALVFGALGMFAAFYLDRLGDLFSIANRIINGLGAPLLALILLGMFSRAVNSAGALAGGILGICASAYVSFAVDDLALHYYALVNLAGTIVLCYICSGFAALVGKGNSFEQLSWRWRGRLTDGGTGRF
ncbi:sodium/solute symporter [Candidatus Sumerlaeota bacterium]